MVQHVLQSADGEVLQGVAVCLLVPSGLDGGDRCVVGDFVGPLVKHVQDWALVEVELGFEGVDALEVWFDRFDHPVLGSVTVVSQLSGCCQVAVTCKCLVVFAEFGDGRTQSDARFGICSLGLLEPPYVFPVVMW